MSNSSYEIMSADEGTEINCPYCGGKHKTEKEIEECMNWWAIK